MSKGERIKQLRENKKMTQEELAKRLHTTKQTISKYEKNVVTNIPSDRIEEMAVVLETTPEFILGWEKVKKNNDAIADIVLKLRTDEDFLEVVSSLCNLDEDQLEGVKHLLTAFVK